jgi:hypothetical protein
MVAPAKVVGSAAPKTQHNSMGRNRTSLISNLCRKKRKNKAATAP